MRPLSNLRPRTEFKLDAKQLRSGFLGMFDAKLGSKNVLADIYYCLVADAFLPGVRGLQPKTDEVKKVMTPKDGGSDFRDRDRSRVVRASLRKNNAAKRLEFRAPLARFNANSIASRMAVNYTFGLKTDEAEYIESLESTPMNGGRLITGKEVAASFKNIPAKARDMLGNCLISLEATKEENDVWLWANFAITQPEAEYLCNCKWLELRLSDIYPTLIDWIASAFGRYLRLPKTITKVSMIANEVKDVLATSEPGKVKPRVGVDNIVADIDGDYYVIPEVDQSADYEQQLMEFGLKDDGSYSWAQIRKLGRASEADGVPTDEGNGDDEEDTDGDAEAVEDNINDMNPGQRKKLPANMPIFSDWLNDKFVYSNTAGNLAVYDLSDTVPATAYHFTQFFDTRITGAEQRGVGGMAAFVVQLVNVAAGFDQSVMDEDVEAKDAKVRNASALINAKTAPGVPTYEPRTFQDLMFRAFKIQDAYAGNNNEDSLYESRDNIRQKYCKIEDLVPDSQFDALKHVGRVIAKAATAIENNMEVLYHRMSVMSALKLLAVARIMKNSAPHSKQIRDLDMQERGKYVNQGIDPNYKAPPISNIKELKINKKTGEVESGLVFQPHQFKVDNLMREHPKCAAYPVDAGGGKTILLMTNILREMQSGTARKPIIACPSTLVNQYVEEAVFVTEGRINIIPVTNQTVRMHGLEKIGKMIEKAPINTIVVTDFDFVKGKAKVLSYGNRNVIMWNNAEWLRQFEFDLMAIDESHKLKNLNSAARQAVSRLMQDVPYKRIASGTLVSDTMTDLVSQIALMDPTIFGSPEKFKAEYGDDVRGGKVISWKKGSHEAIQDKIRANMIWAQARRKEWAALLPPAQEEFWAVDLSENQRLLYDSILKETTDLIEEAMAQRPELKEALESGDETLADDLESMLRPYLARLERFLSAPEEDELASVFLKEEADKISPKVRKIHELCINHIKQKLPGKIVIFTNYKASAKAVYDYAPPELKKLMIHYTAGRKMECRAQFSRDDSKLIMVGQSSSMDTGINFQVASRLIRMETIWTPGILEQGNSRINRPQLKKVEERNMVYFDWIMVNRSIDITKVARLTAKIIDKAKFDNAGPGGDPAYAEIAEMPVIPMKISTIAKKNDFENELLPYLRAYNHLDSVRKEDYRRYQEENEGKLHPVPVAHGKLIEGSKLMSRVPYVPGMALYGTDQLGLVRYDEFCNVDLDELETEDDESEEGEDAQGKDEAISDQDPKAAEKRRHLAELERRWEAERGLAINMPCHTEYGDGVIVGLKKKVWVRFPWSGKMWRIPKLQVFVITRTTTSNKDMRKELLKAVGDLPIDTPIEVPVEVGNETNKIRKKIAEKKIGGDKSGKRPVVEEPEQTGASFQFAVVNDMLAIEYDAENSSPETAAALQNYGFKISPEFWIARVKGPVVMVNLFNNLAAKGFKVDKAANAHLKRIYMVIKKQKSLIGQAGFATSLDITHFLRENVKPSADPHLLKVYPLVRDGLLYMVMPIKGQAANAKAVKVVSPMIQWKRGGGQAEMLRFCRNKQEALQVLQKIKADGINILNTKELEKQWKALKVGGKIKLPKIGKE